MHANDGYNANMQVLHMSSVKKTRRARGGADAIGAQYGGVCHQQVRRTANGKTHTERTAVSRPWFEALKVRQPELIEVLIKLSQTDDAKNAASASDGIGGDGGAAFTRWAASVLDMDGELMGPHVVWQQDTAAVGLPMSLFAAPEEEFVDDPEFFGMPKLDPPLQPTKMLDNHPIFSAQGGIRPESIAGVMGGEYCMTPCSVSMTPDQSPVCLSRSFSPFPYPPSAQDGVGVALLPAPVVMRGPSLRPLSRQNSGSSNHLSPALGLQEPSLDFPDYSLLVDSGANEHVGNIENVLSSDWFTRNDSY